MKRPGIPAYGIAYLRSVVQDSMVDVITIVRPSQPLYDPVTGYATGVIEATAIYTGKAHIHPSTPGGAFLMGEGTEPMNTVTISLPFDAPEPRKDDHVVITLLSGMSDPTLAGETLTVVNSAGGGLGAPVRLLTCTYVAANPFDPSA